MSSVLSGTTYSSGWPGLLGEDRLVLVGDEHVALARLQERGQGVAGAAVP